MMLVMNENILRIDRKEIRPAKKVFAAVITSNTFSFWFRTVINMKGTKNLSIIITVIILSCYQKYLP